MKSFFGTLLISFLCTVSLSQYVEFSNKFNQVMAESEEDLLAEIESHPDYVKFKYPGGVPIPTNKYKYLFPNKEDYQMGILIDPCRGLAYDCCLNIFGTPEYLALKKPGLEAERVVRKLVLANDSVISADGNLVYEDGERVNSPTTSTSTSRMPDDDIAIDPDCEADNVPYPNCVGYRIKNVKSTIRPACTDNNNTLDSLSNCTNIDGTISYNCVQIGFQQNAFIAQCNDNYSDVNNCGTFLEIHLANGSPYVDSETLLSQTKILQSNTSGYYTTTISLHWQNDMKKVLCAYEEPAMRVGSLVYVTSSAPKCCCPHLRTSSRLGAFLCPIAPSGAGPFAAYYTSIEDSLAADGALLEYPFCHGGLDSADSYMCSVYSDVDGVYFTRPCYPVENITIAGNVFLKSPEKTMAGVYDSACPYFRCCAVPKFDECNVADSDFSFRGRVGKVLAIDTTKLVPLVTVTFNGGRSSYVFQQTQLKIETYQSMYEVWWVQRTRSNYIVEKRKGFNVSSPTCTFDLTNNRYFPYTMLDNNGDPIEEHI